MLKINGDAIDALMRNGLRRMRTGHRTPRIQHRLTRRNFGSKRVGAHGHSRGSESEGPKESGVELLCKEFHPDPSPQTWTILFWISGRPFPDGAQDVGHPEACQDAGVSQREFLLPLQSATENG
jgi:hypothetical protein